MRFTGGVRIWGDVWEIFREGLDSSDLFDKNFREGLDSGEMFEILLKDFWKVWGRCLGDLLKIVNMFGRCLEDVWKIFGKPFGTKFQEQLEIPTSNPPENSRS